MGGAGCQLAVSRMRPMLVRLCGTIQQPHPELQRGNVVVRVAAGRPAAAAAVAWTGELAFLLPRLLPFFAAQEKPYRTGSAGMCGMCGNRFACVTVRIPY